MERNRTKGKSSKNGLLGVPKAPERSAVREEVATRLLDLLYPLGLELQKRGSRKQVKKLAEIERKLSQASIHYMLMDYRPDAISLLVTVPGQRWEVDVLEDGEVEWECFKSQGSIFDEVNLEEAVREFAEPNAL